MGTKHRCHFAVSTFLLCRIWVIVVNRLYQLVSDILSIMAVYSWQNTALVFCPFFFILIIGRNSNGESSAIKSFDANSNYLESFWGHLLCPMALRIGLWMGHYPWGHSWRLMCPIGAGTGTQCSPLFDILAQCLLNVQCLPLVRG